MSDSESIANICRAARVAGQKLAASSADARNAVLVAIRDALVARKEEIVVANSVDLEAASSAGISSAVYKRLGLNGEKIDGLVQGLEEVIALPDPLGVVSMCRELTDGLVLKRLTCPIGVICVIFEARPEAVVQIASLAIKSGNAIILKGGREAQRSNEKLVQIIREAIESAAGCKPAATGASDVLVTTPVPATAGLSLPRDTAHGTARLVLQDAPVHAAAAGELAAAAAGGSDATNTAAASVGATGGGDASAATPPPSSSSPSTGHVPVPVDCVQLISTREEVADLLRMDTCIDLVIPRGSNKLVRDIKASTRIPVMGHADGVCAVFIDEHADVRKAAPLVVDSKTHYPAACNAAETLLVHEAVLDTVFPSVAAALVKAGVTLHCDEKCIARADAARATAMDAAITHAASGAGDSTGASGPSAFGAVVAAEESDWTMEWLSLHMSVHAVSSVEEAVTWINAHGSHHTDAIITESAASSSYFTANIDSAGVYVNASTRFADGFRYGFGAEVGISTNRIHARGPVGLEGLLTYKYTLVGGGHCVGQMVAKGAQPASGVEIAGTSLPGMAFTHKDL